MTAPEIQIDVERAKTKLRRLTIVTTEKNKQLRSLSRRYSELVEMRSRLEHEGLPLPPTEDQQRPLPKRRSRVQSRYILLADDLREMPIEQWRERYTAEQMRLAELDAEIDETLSMRDALSASWAASQSVVDAARGELSRRIGQPLEVF